MTLSEKLNRMYVVAISASVAAVLCLYIVLSSGYQKQAKGETQRLLSSLLEGQAPFILQEFVNDRFYAAAVRGKAIAEDHQRERLEVGLYRFDGSPIYETETLKILLPDKQKHGIAPELFELGNSLIVARHSIDFAGQRLGTVFFGKKLDLTKQTTVQNSLFFGLVLLLCFFSILFFASRLFLAKSIVRPIRALVDSIPNIGAYLNSESQDLNLPLDLGSTEINEVLFTLTKMTSQLREALLHQNEIQIHSEKQIAVSNIAQQVAHDVRSPLAALDMISRDLDHLPEEKRTILRSAVARIKDIANDLLERNRNKPSLTHPTSMATTDEDGKTVQLLSGLVESLISEQRMHHRDKFGVEIDGMLDHDSYGVFSEVRPAEFKRVLSNLINNAVEAVGDEGRVGVSLTRLNGTATLKIVDDGPGIPKHILEKLGLRGITYGKENGSGLGYFYAKSTVESWGGSIDIKCTPDVGTVVTICLPEARPPMWFVPNIEVDVESKIVVLDDDSSIHMIWKRRLDVLFSDLREETLIHFSSTDDLIEWHVRKKDAHQKISYLIDYELIGSAMTGLDLIETLNIESDSILVTSRFEEPEIRNRCERLHVRIIPKGLAGFVPVIIGPQKKSIDAIILDDDKLVHLMWCHSAKTKGKVVKTFDKVADFETFLTSVSYETPLFIDYDLGSSRKGGEIAKQCFERGYSNIFLATGYPPENFQTKPWIKAVVSKDPIWI